MLSSKGYFPTLYFSIIAEFLLRNMRLTNSFTAVYARDTMPAMKPSMISFKFVENEIKKNLKGKNEYYFFEFLIDQKKTFLCLIFH